MKWTDTIEGIHKVGYIIEITYKNNDGTTVSRVLRKGSGDYIFLDKKYVMRQYDWYTNKRENTSVRLFEIQLNPIQIK